MRELAEFAVVGGALQRIALDISPTGQSDETRAALALAGDEWYDRITAEIFD